MGIHSYRIRTVWTGNDGEGTRSYASYRRDFTVQIDGKPDQHCSSDPAFRGNPSRINPEEQFLSALSGCHMLWYLHLCSTNGITVLEYSDVATGEMVEDEDGAGRFVSVLLNPKVLILEDDRTEKARSLHNDANRMCFIANSCNFPVLHNPVVTVR
ncbi:OsmC family protein [Rhodohalobacter mucosus]|uniref:Peroxiredoxin n=1 Tax=Rhodohalobacter mucosus TaxID=2079485 RepID=A0A316TU99_9BACT|nr:OsmC family protein [Rhodohalobacter mucosus]PWN07231.1 peroxiredoxin [Rhodohalobacter mucosus]